MNTLRPDAHGVATSSAEEHDQAIPAGDGVAEMAARADVRDNRTEVFGRFLKRYRHSVLSQIAGSMDLSLDSASGTRRLGAVAIINPSRSIAGRTDRATVYRFNLPGKAQ